MEEDSSFDYNKVAKGLEEIEIEGSTSFFFSLFIVVPWD